MKSTTAARAVCLTSAVAALSVFAATSASADTPALLLPGDLLVSTSTYPTTPPDITAGQTQLPPGCGATSDPCATAVAGGAYPQVFNNDSIDPAFGVTSPIVLDQLTTGGTLLTQTTVPNSSQSGVTASSDQMVTSFSSKSELALNQSTDDSSVSFMGYDAPVGAVDVSNSSTAGAPDPTDPVTGSYYRSIAQLTNGGGFSFTNTNDYSGNNGRAAILNSSTGQYYTVGNGGNGNNPEPQGVVTGTGAQLVQQATGSQSSQTPGAPTPLGNFNVTELGGKADKSAKDDNFRGLTVSNGVVYTTKGSGSNGVDTVYYVDTTGGTCPNGTGVPAASATLPTTSVPAYSTSNSALGLSTTNPGLAPTNMCILSGFPTTLAKGTPTYYPFGIWFANPTTLYVADEGSGTDTYDATSNTYTAAAASTTAGLEKWTLNPTTNTWSLAYTLQNGLNLGQPYTVAGYPTGNNSYTSGGSTVSLPWAPATNGLRNLSGHVNGDGTVTLWAATSTVSGSGDQGADPNKLVSITDDLAATTLPATESFSTVLAAANATTVRGVTYLVAGLPGTPLPEFPWLPLAPISAAAIGGAAVLRRRRRAAARA